MGNRKSRLCLIHIRCDEDDRALFDHKAKKAGMSRSEFIRNLLYHGSIEHYANYTKEDAAVLLSELCRISNSMAYIAYSARLKCCVDEGDYLELEANFISLVESFYDHITN